MFTNRLPKSFFYVLCGLLVFIFIQPMTSRADETPVMRSTPTGRGCSPSIGADPVKEQIAGLSEQLLMRSANPQIQISKSPFTSAALQDSAEITLWAYDPYFQPLQDIANSFMADNPNYTVNLQFWSSADDLRTNYMVAHQAGASPDLIVGSDSWITQLANQEMLRIIPQDIINMVGSQYIPASLEACQCQNKKYLGLPITTTNVALIYNPEMLLSAGLGDSPPTTWDDVNKYAAAINAQGSYGFFALPEPFFFQSVQSAFGESLFGVRDGEEGTLIYDANNVTLDSKGAVDALRWAVDMIKNGYMPNVDYSKGTEMFQTGQLAMMLNGPWVLQNLNNSGTPYRIAGIPSGPDGAGVPFIGVDAFMISSQTPNIDAVTAFLEYVIGNQDRMFSLSKGASLPSALSAQLDQGDDMAVFASVGQNGIFAPDVPPVDENTASWRQALTSAYNGDLAPEDALAKAAEEIRNNVGSSK